MAVAARGGGDEGFGELTSLLGGLLEELRINFIGGAFLPFDCDCVFPTAKIAVSISQRARNKSHTI
jgi:hypothetical protein